MTNNYTKTELDNIAIPILEEVLQEAQTEWSDINSKYREYRNLQIDKRGSFGERFFSEVLHKIYKRRIVIEYQDGDCGDWDLKINGIKFEIKTSSIDVNKKFQNEGIKQNGDYDGILFLGITPNQLYIKFTLKTNISFEKLHNRKKQGTGSGHKWDFREKDMIKVNNIEEIKKEFENCFNSLLNKKNK